MAANGEVENYEQMEKPMVRARNTLSLPVSDGLTGSWSPRKLSSQDEIPERSPARRKLSENRGINLPEIKLRPEGITNATFTLHTDESIETPLPTASPLGHFNLPPIDQGRCGASLDPKLREIIDICVFLPDHKGLVFKVEGGRIATAGHLLHLVYEQQGIMDYAKADQLFGLWMCSPLLEIQLKPHHYPYVIRIQWQEILRRFTTASLDERIIDEPLVIVRRNVYLSKRRQIRLIKCGDVETEMLFRDAKECIMNGCYPCPFETCLQLAAYSMALMWGPYKSSTHTLHFIRNKMEEIIPPYQASTTKKFSIFGWSFPLSGCRGLENQLLELYKNVSSMNVDQLQWEYLTTCMKLPVYGAAFFNGQIERPVAFGCAYAPVIVAISQEYFCILDPSKRLSLLTLPVEDCNWQRINEPTEGELLLPSFYIHFINNDLDYGHHKYKDKGQRSCLVQIFSKQAVMMDALLNSSLDIRIQERDLDQEPTDDETDNQQNIAPGQRLFNFDHGRRSDTMFSNHPMYVSKLSRLCAATIDSNGKCLEARGLLKNILDGQN